MEVEGSIKPQFSGNTQAEKVPDLENKEQCDIPLHLCALQLTEPCQSVLSRGQRLLSYHLDS